MLAMCGKFCCGKTGLEKEKHFKHQNRIQLFGDSFLFFMIIKNDKVCYENL